jgi:hypothetical protein
MGTVRAAFKRAPTIAVPHHGDIHALLARHRVRRSAQDFLDNIELKRVLADIRRALNRRSTSSAWTHA